VRKILTDCSTLITPFSQALVDEVSSSLVEFSVTESKGEVLEGKVFCVITLSSLSCNKDERILKSGGRNERGRKIREFREDDNLLRGVIGKSEEENIAVDAMLNGGEFSSFKWKGQRKVLLVVFGMYGMVFVVWLV